MRSSPATGATTLSVDPDGRVATILISGSGPLHTLPPELLTELDRILPLAAKAQVVILRAGDKTTSVNAEQSFPRPTAADSWRQWTPLGHHVFDHIAHLPPPTIAVIDGLAIGIGADLALACDLRVATTNANAGACEVGLGTIPGCSETQRLTQLIGRERATQIRHSTPHLDAATALAWGLLTNVTPAAGLEHYLDQLIRSVLDPTPGPP